MSDLSTIDLSSARFGHDIPFESFSELRKRAPVFWYEPDEYWVITSYELVREINRDFEAFSNWAGPLGAGVERDPSDEPRGVNTILTMDPPKHTIYRRLINSSFTARPVQAMEPMIRRLARELIEEFAAKGGGEWVTEVAARFPVRVMADLMGIPREDEDYILELVNVQVFGEAADGRELTPEEVKSILIGGGEYADRLIEEHRRRPRGDLVDQIIDARIDGEPLSPGELQAWVALYLGAGAETTKHLLSNGIVCLLGSPEARAAVREGQLLKETVEELLRFITPVMHHSRWPVKHTEVGGQKILAGQRTTLWMISANRDESIFSDPNTFDITRKRNPHDSFGPTGPHFCVGAGVARLESRVFLEELGPYLDRIEVSGEPVRGESNVFNILASCPVTIS